MRTLARASVRRVSIHPGSVMNATAILRAALWLTAVWNIGAAAAFVAPERLGALLGLPGGSSPFYTLLLAYVIGVFGVVYAWLARRPWRRIWRC